jgi:hypothetical protein
VEVDGRKSSAPELIWLLLLWRMRREKREKRERERERVQEIKRDV